MLPPRRRPNASDLSLLETHWLTDAQLAAVWLQAETADQPRMVQIVGHGLAGRAPLSMSLCSPLPIGDDDHWCSAVRADHRNLG